ncbi:MAG: arsenate reductase ArsC [Acholeplasmataceae bacterium]
MVRVLFVCVHNSARSQMGETYLNDFGKDLFVAESAGIEAGTLNPNVVEVMKEEGYDISKNQTDSVFEFFKQNRQYSFVIKVCDEIHGQKCPIFPHALNDLYWNIEDPSAFEGSKEEVLEKTRQVRDQIKAKVHAFIEEHRAFAEKRKQS